MARCLQKKNVKLKKWSISYYPIFVKMYICDYIHA